MTATFPSGVKQFPVINPGDPILSSTENAQQEEIVAIEQALLGEITDGNVQYVKKPATSTDNAVPRFDGTDGKKIQNSGVTIDDSNNIKVGTAPVPTSVTSSTDNAIVRFDGTGGNKIQNSDVTIDDNGKLSGNGLDGWIYDTDTWTYVSTTSFKITGKDVRYRFPEGTKIKLVQSSTTKYFYVVATDYSADTTITITGGSDYALANATISGQAYSYANAPQGYPFKDIHIDVVRTTAQSIPNNSWTAISLDSIRSEEKPATSSQWSSGSPTHLTCRLPGRYLIVASVRFAGNSTGGRGINIKVNGAWKMAVLVPPPGTLETIISISDIISLQTDDYVEVFVYQNSGAALNANANSDNTGIKWQRIGM